MKKLLGDVAIYGSGDFAIRFLSFAVFPVYAHVFSVEEFGIMALVGAITGVVAIILNLGTSHAVQRYYWDPETPDDERPVVVSTGLWLLLASAMSLTVATLLLAYGLRDLLQERYDVMWLFMLLSLSSNVPSELLRFSQNVLRLHFKPWRFLTVSACNNLFGVILGLYMILYLDLGLTGIFLGGFLGVALSLPLGIWLISHEIRLSFNLAWARKLIRFGYPFIFSGLAYWVFGSLDRWMLSELSDNAQVGLYSIAFKFATALIMINTAFGQAWSPYAIKIFADEPNYREVFSRVLSYLLFFLALAGLGLSLFGREVLMLTTPEEYWAAATPVGIVTMSMVLAGTQQITGLGISLEKRTHLFSLGAWVTALLNFVMNLVLIPHWGAAGAAMATFVSYGVLSSMYLYWTQKLHPIPLEKYRLIYSLALVMAGLVASAYLNTLAWIPMHILLKLGLIVAVIALTFTLGIFSIKEFSLNRKAEAKLS